MPAYPSTGPEECLLIPRSVIESSERLTVPMYIGIGEKLSRKSRFIRSSSVIAMTKRRQRE